VIRLQGVSKTYEVGGQPIHALDDATEHIRPGEYVAVMGPSGSGKSTILAIIGCLLRPTCGSYRLNGREVATLTDQELSRLRQELIGFIFQTFHLVPRLTATANVELPMIFAGISKEERQERVASVLQDVGLADRVHHRPSQLSVGQRQRLVIARAMIMKPQVLLADEPTGNLDSHSAQQVMELIEGLHAKGLTVIVVTHAPEVARRAERLLLLRDGKIVQRMAAKMLTSPIPSDP
jgi:putative ABC transport system ATP-binding protein